MEEVLVVVFQIFFEVVLQSLGWLPLEFSSRSDRGGRGCGWLVLHAVVGGLAGFVSALVFPNLLLPFAALRVANLIVAPLVVGGLGYLFARWRQARGRAADGWAHFWHGFLFALMFGLARFAFAAR